MAGYAAHAVRLRYPVVESARTRTGRRRWFQRPWPRDLPPPRMRAPPYRGRRFCSGWPGRRQVDGIAKFDGEATRPDLPDQVPVMALEHILGDAVQLGGFLGANLPLQFKRRQIGRGC